MQHQQRPMWTPDAVRGLGVTTTVATAAQILLISPSTAYRMARANRFPVRLIPVGRRRHVVPVGPLIRLLEVD
jgi:hypothetical protein